VQVVTPSGGVYTFTTSNAVYPTAYVTGEVYCFHAQFASVGGDRFQVNGLPSLPIYKITGPGGANAPIIAGDIIALGMTQLTYDGGLNAGAGGFWLLNPFVPIGGDGSGGITTSSITVSGSINGYALGAYGILYPIGEGHGIAFGWNGTNLIAHVDGTNNPGALATAASLGNYLPLSGGTVTGNLGVSGNLTTGGTGYFGGDVTIHGGGAAALNVDNGGITVAGLSSFGADLAVTGTVSASVLAGPSGSAGNIKCYGGDWGNMAFAISGGSFHISPDNGSSGYVFSNAGAFSDARLKTDIRDTDVDALAAICATPVRAFAWNERGRELMPYASPEVPCGLVAQELEETIPFAVGISALAGDMRHIDHQNLVPHLLRAIQQLTERVVQLEHVVSV
jgi:hypothetical protein